MAVPLTCKHHVWQGSGTAQKPLTGRLLECLISHSSLPTADMLARDSDLEASALRALDLADENRICALFHADDPLFPASSAGEMQRTMDLVYEWSMNHGATFNVTCNRTVVFCMNGFGEMPSIVCGRGISFPVTLKPATSK